MLAPAQSKSRRLAAKACWAAWVRMADQRERREASTALRRMSGAALAFVRASKRRNVRLPCRKPYCSSGCVGSCEPSLRPNMKIAKSSYNVHSQDTGNQTPDIFSLVPGNILKNIICEESSTFLFVSTVAIMCSRALKKSSGKCFQSSGSCPRLQKHIVRNAWRTARILRSCACPLQKAGQPTGMRYGSIWR